MKYSINLASRSYVNRRALYFGYLGCGVILVASLVFNFGYFLKLRDQAATTEQRLTELEQKILESQGGEAASYSASRYSRVLKEIKSANVILEQDAFRWTALLGQLEKVVPWDVSIEKIEPDHRTRSVKVSGLAKELSDMKRLLDNMIKSGDYSDVLLLNQALVDVESGKPLLRFSVELRGAF